MYIYKPRWTDISISDTHTLEALLECACKQLPDATCSAEWLRARRGNRHETSCNTNIHRIIMLQTHMHTLNISVSFTFSSPPFAGFPSHSTRRERRELCGDRVSVFVTRLLSLKFNPPSRFSQFLPINLRQLGEDKKTDSEREGDSDRCSGRQRVLRGKKKEVTRWMMLFFFFLCT